MAGVIGKGLKYKSCFGVLIIFICSCSPKPAEKLTIATAANLQFAIDKLVESFTRETGISCETVVSSSGKLTAQIEAGAPFHVFVSADLKYPKRLSNQGLTYEEPIIYAFGKLVLWTQNPQLTPSIKLLQSDSVTSLAIANPETAPYGLAAEQALKHYNIYGAVYRKLVYGESIAQTNQFISSGAAEVGFTAKSVVLSSALESPGHWIDVDQDAYSPIAQAVVMLKTDQEQKDASKKFIEYILSSQGKEILDNFGYETSGL